MVTAQALTEKYVRQLKNNNIPCNHVEFCVTSKFSAVFQVMELHLVGGIYVICKPNYINTEVTMYQLLSLIHKKKLLNHLKLLDVKEFQVNEE